MLLYHIIWLHAVSASTNVLESTPPSVNGVLTACAGEQISLTCTHNYGITVTTQWTIGPPLNCSAVVTHQPIDGQSCRECMLECTNTSPPDTTASSTAVATAKVSMSGSIVQCIAGNVIKNFIVGNITLCIASWWVTVMHYSRRNN